MDIRQTLAKTAPRKRRAPWVAGAVALLMACAAIYVYRTDALDLREHWSTRVRKGPLDIFVSGYGRLKSEQPRLLSSPAAAVVDAIRVKPGENVTADTIIMHLLDPETVDDVSRARLAWANASSDSQVQALKNKDEELEIRSRILDLQSQRNSLAIERQATEKAVNAGVMPRIDLEKITIRLQQLEGQLDFEKQRLQSMDALHGENLRAKQLVARELERQLHAEQQKLDSLAVRPGIVGVLQELYVKAGESVALGGKLALVGSTDRLYAELSVPQRDIAKIRLGQRVELDTFGGKARGEVSRIDPLVADGRVVVDVRLLPPLPANARPELAIEGRVVVAQRRDALFIDAPPDVREGQSYELFAVDEERGRANKVRLDFGLSSGRYIEIKSGAREGQLLLLVEDATLKAKDEIPVTSSGKQP